jgi:hypothetical protein
MEKEAVVFSRQFGAASELSERGMIAQYVQSSQDSDLSFDVENITIKITPRRNTPFSLDEHLCELFHFLQGEPEETPKI